MLIFHYVFIKAYFFEIMLSRFGDLLRRIWCRYYVNIMLICNSVSYVTCPTIYRIVSLIRFLFCNFVNRGTPRKLEKKFWFF